jgi:hypothetical protein
MTATTATKATKVATYSAEQTAQLAATYVGDARNGETVEALSLLLGKSVKSIVSKLVRMDLYVKPERLTKTGEKVEKKDATAEAIGAILSMTEAEVDSLTKSNKSALRKIFDALANSKPIDGVCLTQSEGASLNRASMEVRRKVFDALEMGEFGELDAEQDDE